MILDIRREVVGQGRKRFFKERMGGFEVSAHAGIGNRLPEACAAKGKTVTASA